MRNRVRAASGKTGTLIVEIAAALFIGIGIPLFWIWVGSLIQGARGAQMLEATTAAIMIVGVLVSYILALLVAAAIEARGRPHRPPPNRYPWMRSMRDEPYRAGVSHLTPVEMVFVGTAVVAMIAMTIWFFGFAGSPLPS
jgi:hypothetical protein